MFVRLTALILLALTLTAAGCASPLQARLERHASGRTALVIEEAESLSFPVMTLVPSTGVVDLVLLEDQRTVLIRDDRGQEYSLRFTRECEGDFELEGTNAHFLQGKRFVVGRGGALMVLDGWDYTHWTEGRNGWWTQPEVWDDNSYPIYATPRS